MADSSTLLIKRSLVAYILHLSLTEYIPHSIASSCNSYGSPIASEKLSIYNYDPALFLTRVGGFYTHIKPIMTPMPTSFADPSLPGCAHEENSWYFYWCGDRIKTIDWGHYLHHKWVAPIKFILCGHKLNIQNCFDGLPMSLKSFQWRVSSTCVAGAAAIWKLVL